ncbi:hypothetical protein OF83DRAFT_1048215 [Amylostereum chailletii]|nr:hypothetical protein OF83DRAFT_1048215 [Amylostereum chailletii]
MATSLSQLSASVTRILSLTGFSKDLKTRDIQTAFLDWENVNGGFKIKWLDDTSLLIVFADATVAKRAYLQCLSNTPAVFSAPEAIAIIRPYDGPDAQSIIQNVNSRGQNPTRGHNARSSSVALPNQRNKSISISTGNSINGGLNGVGNGNGVVDGQPGSLLIPPTSPIGREGSPTLPTLPSHPTLDSLINSSLADGAAPPPADPAILAMGPPPNGAGPRIGDPGKRMLGAALGVRHPALGPRNADQGMKEMQRAMGGLVVAE